MQQLMLKWVIGKRKREYDKRKIPNKIEKLI
nr:hypothetical protein BSM_00480 [uncultured archaeon]